MKRCTVTAIAADGRRSTIEVGANSRNYAAIAYNYRATGSADLVKPDHATLFEITPEGSKPLCVRWADVLAWANAKARK